MPPAAVAAATDASRADQLFTRFQQYLPTRFLSWLVFKLSRLQLPAFKSLLIRMFMQQYRIRLDEAVHDKPGDYASFNDFFTRALKPHARPIDVHPKSIASPVDGTVSQAGQLTEGRIFQAKGHDYSLVDLLGGDPALALPFTGGTFATIYLAPHNYHRIHMPISGTLKKWIYVPGRLFSVNPATVRAMPGVFAKNERVVSLFETDAGPFALIMVGALFVGSMETTWGGLVTPPHKRNAPVDVYEPYSTTTLGKGFEMGRFNMGSTVILLHKPGRVTWSPALVPGAQLRVGQAIGMWK
ncbi:MAG TPA: archaetidylserine decarboxylase [Solimonas sp.]|nr:archaetidylserine decarboxylase [Solimonas sp.]